MFTSTFNRGFQMTFNNGLTISVQFGTGNYCERRNMTTSYRGDMDGATPIIKSGTAEIAIWNTEQVWFNFGSDTVKGWCDTDEVAHWISLTQTVCDIDELTKTATSLGMLKISDDCE